MEEPAAPAVLSGMKKNDIILIGVLLTVALAAVAGISLYLSRSTKQPEAVVYLDGEEQGRYPLGQEQAN